MNTQEAIEKFKKIKRGNIFLIHQRVEGKEVIEDYSLCDMAISALEKQIPKKLQNLHRFMGREKCVGTCPACGYVCCSDYGDYCGGCGQAICWTEGE